MNKNFFSQNKSDEPNNNKTNDIKKDSIQNLSKEQLKEFNKELVNRNLLVGHHMTIIISCLELMMIIYSLFVFDFSRTRHVTYLVLYCCLFVISLLAFFCIKYMIKQPVINIKAAKFLTYGYLFFIVLWGIGISLLDMMVGNQSVVFFTVIIGVTGILLLPPKSLISIIVLSVGMLLSLVYLAKCDVSIGFIINICIFAIIIFILCFRRYKDFILDYLQREELIRVNLQLELISKHDELTELLNRSAMNIGLEDALTRCLASKQPLAVIMIDIDDFKKINDTHGHKVGDECIKAIALLIKNTAWQGEVYRYGGEEFFIIMEDIEIEKAIILGENILNEVAQLRLPQYPKISMTVSSGLYCATPEETDNTDNYLIGADRNLYMAKNAGKNKLIY